MAEHEQPTLVVQLEPLKKYRVGPEHPLFQQVNEAVQVFNAANPDQPVAMPNVISVPAALNFPTPVAYAPDLNALVARDDAEENNPLLAHELTHAQQFKYGGFAPAGYSGNATHFMEVAADLGAVRAYPDNPHRLIEGLERFSTHANKTAVSTINFTEHPNILQNTYSFLKASGIPDEKLAHLTGTLLSHGQRAWGEEIVMLVDEYHVTDPFHPPLSVRQCVIDKQADTHRLDSVAQDEKFTVTANWLKECMDEERAWKADKLALDNFFGLAPGSSSAIGSIDSLGKTKPMHGLSGSTKISREDLLQK